MEGGKGKGAVVTLRSEMSPRIKKKTIKKTQNADVTG